MKKILLTTVAVAALAGFTTIASAQDTKGGAAKPAGGMEEKAAPAPSGGGAAMKPSAPAAHSAQGAESGKPSTQPEQRMGQEQKPQAAPQRGAQEERQEHGGMQQKGAQDEHSMQQKGAQEEHSMQPKGAQTESTTKSNVSESNKSSTGMSANKGGERGAHVQISSDQRTKIHAMIASGGHRVTTSEHFDVSVGVKIPRSVHIEVIPDDVVEIVPEYRGFDYVMVGDEILIIDPDTLEIVAVINA
ncbi:MAG TPA: DUF1236 domain-containing protein [Xanthobacteraceae bacterium]|nr:DUF1236 domain-containing protein [Xanthobacteraceae bacterium]